MTPTQEWPTSRCLRTLRPLKAKVLTLKTHCLNFPIYEPETTTTLKSIMTDSDNESDEEANESLVIEEHVIKIKKTRRGYKRRKVSRDPVYTEDNEPSHLPPLFTNKSRFTNDTWRLVSDVLDALRTLFQQHVDGPMKLSHLSAFRIGVHVGKNDREIKNLKEQLVENGELIGLYDAPNVRMYTKWVMLGHALGYFLENVPVFKDLVEDLLFWGREYAASRIILEHFIQTVDPIMEYENLVVLSRTISYRGLDGKIMERLAQGTDSPCQLNQIQQLIYTNHRQHYTESLVIISKVIRSICMSRSETPSLVETVHSLDPEQSQIIQLLALFIEILHPHHRHNIEFLTQVYQSCKIGYRSLIPVLKIVKCFLTKSSPPQQISREHKLILRTIFSPHAKVTPRFIQYISTKPVIRHVQISTGDLI